jgi:acyl-CoA synthetase (AMP-forming)/AMP-acid ligase II
MNLFTLLDQAAIRFPQRGAIHVGHEQFATYEELRSRALRLAGGLRSRYRLGDRVAILS